MVSLSPDIPLISEPPYCCLPHAHRFAFVFLAWDFPQVTQTSAILTPARSTALKFHAEVVADDAVLTEYGRVIKTRLGFRSWDSTRTAQAPRPLAIKFKIIR
ncbi:hypothetical protein Tco_1043904 [Tanacetum coccineum]|uniref:Uncharacterized protein n=1 Tax=Tanacetum coccineum TaxID=301880 RepID=A0ABQ5GPM8_9ASTR